MSERLCFGEITWNIKTSISILKRVPDVLEYEGKGYLYTNDPDHKGMFDKCQEERPKIAASFVQLRREVSKQVDETHRVYKEIEDLEKLFDGFYIMIGELEVEESVAHYCNRIEDAFEKLADTIIEIK